MDSFLLYALVSVGSAIIPLSLGIAKIRFLDFYLVLIVGLCGFAFIADVGSIVILFNAINNWPVINIFLIVQTLVLLFILAQWLALTVKWILLILYSLISIYNYAFVQSPKVFNSFTNYVGAVGLIILSLVYLYRLLIEVPAIDICHCPPIWVVFAILIYYGGTLFLFLFNNYLLSTNVTTHKSIWVLHNSLNITKNLFFAHALWQHLKKVRLSH